MGVFGFPTFRSKISNGFRILKESLVFWNLFQKTPKNTKKPKNTYFSGFSGFVGSGPQNTLFQGLAKNRV
jgi:hypothetical protein